MTLSSILKRLSIIAVGLFAPMAAAAAVDVSPDAARTLEQMRRAYASLSALELTGTMSAHSEGYDQQPQEMKSTFSATYSAPAEFCHRFGTELVLANTPTRLYLYRADHNDLLSTEPLRARTIGSELNAAVREDLWSQNPSLLLAIVPDATAELLDGATAASMGMGAGGSDCLKIDRSDGKLELQIDPSTHLIRSARRDLTGAMGPKLAPVGTSFVLNVQYTDSKPLDSVPAGQVSWTPPADARAYQAPTPLADDDAPATKLEGKAAPNFRLQNLEGKWVTLSKLKGSVVVLDFWQTTCGPCREALPVIDQMAKDKASKGLRAYAINLSEDPQLVLNFVKDMNLTLPVLYDAKQIASQAYLVATIPETVVIDRDGIIRKVVVGYAGGDTQVEDAVDKVLAEKPDAGK